MEDPPTRLGAAVEMVDLARDETAEAMSALIENYENDKKPSDLQRVQLCDELQRAEAERRHRTLQIRSQDLTINELRSQMLTNTRMYALLESQMQELRAQALSLTQALPVVVPPVPLIPAAVPAAVLAAPAADQEQQCCLKKIWRMTSYLTRRMLNVSLHYLLIGISVTGTCSV